MRRLCRCPDGRWDEHGVSCIYSDEFAVGVDEVGPHPRVRPRVRVCESCGREHVTGAGSLCELCDDFVRGAYRDWLER